MSMIDRVRRTLHRHRLVTPSTRVVAALSGGPDSIVLVRILRVLAGAGDLQLVAIAHFNHQLRSTADEDERFCASVAADLGLPFTADRADVRALSVAARRSVEDTAHHVRHAFFERAAREHSAGAVAVGHTRDDQAETFLLRLVRGAGTRGLASMHPRHGLVIRPLLECSRDDVRAFVQAHALPFVHDASNDDVAIPRNRVRAELLPHLRDRFNPRIVEVLAAEAELARADESLLDALAVDAGAACVSRDHADTGRWTIAIEPLMALPEAVAWRVLHGAMSRAAGNRPIGFTDVLRAWSVVTEGTADFDAPGQRVQRVGPFVVLSSRPAGSSGRRPAVSTSPIAAFRRVLSVPGEVALPEIGCVMSAEVLPSASGAQPESGVHALVPMERVAGGLAVRNRRPGDRLRASAVGHRKLQDLLVDRKVPRGERDRIPIVVDAADRIVWVAGHALDRDFQVSEPAQAVVMLRLKGVGGSC